jgi:phosphate starvation-inducible PhoH-like protein
LARELCYCRGLTATIPTTATNGKLALDDQAAAMLLFGAHNANLRLIGELTGTTVNARGTEVSIVGEADEVALARTLIEQLYGFSRRGTPLGSDDIARAAHVLKADRRAELRQIFSDTVVMSGRSRPITPKGLAQKAYVEAMRAHDVVFGIGPAGTGKTYLAMAMAVRMLADKAVKRVILARPAVEAGEKLGFLPGSMEEKVNPYLRPLYDALHDMMDFERAEQLVQKGVIEVAPLAFMRGRTLNDAFVILDEAQNTTSEQMKMFLTRLGYGSKAVVTGDVTQIDLPTGQRSGLAEVRQLLHGIEGISFCYFSDVDVVRHPLVQKIIRAYEERGGQHHKPSPRAHDKPGALPAAVAAEPGPPSGGK